MEMNLTEFITVFVYLVVALFILHMIVLISQMRGTHLKIELPKLEKDRPDDGRSDAPAQSIVLNSPPSLNQRQPQKL